MRLDGIELEDSPTAQRQDHRFQRYVLASVDNYS
jgi:hypothetical protein